MGLKTIEEFLISLKIDKEGLSGISKGFKQTDSGLNKLKTGVSKAKIAFLGLAASAAAVSAGINKLIDTTAKWDELSDSAGRIGITPEALRAIQYQASIMDSSAEAATQSLENFGAEYGKLAQGMTSRAKQAFENLNISLRKSNGEMRPMLDVLKEIGQKTKDMPKEAQLGIAKLLQVDKSFLQMMTDPEMLARLESLHDTMAKAVGIDINKLAQDSSNLMDIWSTIKEFIALAMGALLQALMPKSTGNLMTDLKTFFDEKGPKIRKTIQTIARAIELVGKALSAVLEVVSAFSNMPGWLKSTLKILGSLVAGVWLFNIACAANPIGLILVGAIALLTGLYMMWKKYGDSIISWFSNAWTTVSDFFSMIWGWVKKIFEYSPLGLLIKGLGALKGGLSAVLGSNTTPPVATKAVAGAISNSNVTNKKQTVTQTNNIHITSDQKGLIPKIKDAIDIRDALPAEA